MSSSVTRLWVSLPVSLEEGLSSLDLKLREGAVFCKMAEGERMASLEVGLEEEEVGGCEGVEDVAEEGVAMAAGSLAGVSSGTWWIR